MAQMTWTDGRQTWYRTVGEITPGTGPAPVMICHGGPGATHDYCEPIADLARAGRACVLYDQIGNGKSQHRPDAPAEFWTPQLFRDELVALTRHLGIAERYVVIGQSWGGMLAMEHALDHPSGLRAMGQGLQLDQGNAAARIAVAEIARSAAGTSAQPGP